MRKLSLILSALGLGLAAGPALAQDMPSEPMEAQPPPPPVDPNAAMTPERQAAYDSWPADQRAAFDAWPADVQAYYWSLSPPRQEVFWRISDNDKLALTAMNEEDRAAAWQMVEQKMLNSDPPASAPDADTGEPAPLPDDKR